MGLKVRVIPTLLIKNGSLVKGKGFDSWRNIGAVLPAIKVYTMRLVDEMIILNIKADSPDIELIEEVSSECFVPLTVGGGVKTLDDIRNLLAAGADKVAINTEAYENPDLITEAAKMYGSQCIVVSIDVLNGSCYKKSGEEITEKDPLSWAKQMESRGAGELLITSIDRDGMMSGYDHHLINEICANTSLPVIASGGACSVNDCYEAIDCGASAIAAASLFQFTELTPAILKSSLGKKGVMVRK